MADVTPEEAKLIVADWTRDRMELFEGLFFRELIQRTPVLTGRARASWNVGLEQPDRTYSETAADPSGEATARRGDAVIHGSFGARVYMTSSCPYMQTLAYDKYKRGGYFMVEHALAGVRRMVQKAGALAGKWSIKGTTKVG